jgi:tRNA(adenine34) deaminase
MQQAYKEALIAKDIGEIPVGAVIVYKNKIIAKGHNRSIIDNDVSAHAEIVALRKASAYLKNYRLQNCEIYVTLEPCPMCAYALIMARVSKIIYAAKDEKLGSCDTVFNFCNNKKFNHKIKIISGIMQKESSELLKKFFLEKRI